MKYQDTWINGKTELKGKRECASRYEIIRDYCKSLPQGFTVCDIGANMSYFGLRLIEDFGCSVIAFEFDQYEMRAEIIKKSKVENLMYLKRKVSLSDLRILNKCCHYDVVLALSVLHHLPGSSSEWIKGFRKLGNNLIMEFALNDSKRVDKKIDYSIPEDAIILGYGISHLKKDFNRPIILLK